MTSFVGVLSACGGGGGGGNETKITGRIQNVVQAESSGIIVDAVVNGAIVDSDTTDSSGQFELRVREEALTENVRIVFDTDPILTLDIITIQGSDISLVVSLAPDAGEVAIGTFQIDSDDLECEGTESFSYIAPRVTTMNIDGDGGGHCIRARDECRFTIEIGGRLNIGRCSDGVSAEDDSEVRLTPGSTSSLNVQVGGRGLRATDGASIIATGFDVNIVGNDFGISAKDDAFVQVSVPVVGTCAIVGGKEAIDAGNSTIVDIGECRTN